jgi:hypothetical protein
VCSSWPKCSCTISIVHSSRPKCQTEFGVTRGKGTYPATTHQVKLFCYVELKTSAFFLAEVFTHNLDSAFFLAEVFTHNLDSAFFLAEVFMHNLDSVFFSAKVPNRVWHHSRQRNLPCHCTPSQIILLR